MVLQWNPNLYVFYRANFPLSLSFVVCCSSCLWFLSAFWQADTKLAIENLLWLQLRSKSLGCFISPVFVFLSFNYFSLVLNFKFYVIILFVFLVTHALVWPLSRWPGNGQFGVLLWSGLPYGLVNAVASKLFFAGSLIRGYQKRFWKFHHFRHCWLETPSMSLFIKIL